MSGSATAEPTMTTETTNPKYVARITRDCVSNAKELLGNGWDHVSVDVRRALAMSELVAVMRAQDDSIPAEKTLANLNAVAWAIDTEFGNC